MARLHLNFIGGLVEDNPLAVAATTLTSAALAAVPAIAAPDYMPITLDPDGIDGAPEIVWVTAHTAGATTATIARAQESTTARQHLRDIEWVHAITARQHTIAKAIVYGTWATNQSIPTAADTMVTFTGGSPAGVWASGNPTRLTVPAGWDGDYLIGASVMWAANSAGYRYHKIRRNGSTDLQYWETPGAGGTPNIGWSSPLPALFSVVSLVAGDYLEILVRQSSGSAVNVIHSADLTFLTIMRMN